MSNFDTGSLLCRFTTDPVTVQPSDDGLSHVRAKTVLLNRLCLWHFVTVAESWLALGLCSSQEGSNNSSPWEGVLQVFKVIFEGD